MKTLFFTSLEENTGKTSIMIGLASLLDKKIGYLKPLGDKLHYIRKKNWDYDSNMMIRLLGLTCEPEQVTIGHNQSKLRFMYDRESMQVQLQVMMEQMSSGKDLVFIESAKCMTYGASLGLDAGAQVAVFEPKVICVISGKTNAIIDQLYYLQNQMSKIMKIDGVIINKVDDLDDFEQTCLPVINKLKTELYGVVPFEKELNEYTVAFIAEKLFAQVIAGEQGENNKISNYEVGIGRDIETSGIQANAGQTCALTTGDNTVVIQQLIERNIGALLLTNGIMPDSQIISLANSKNVPMLLVNRSVSEVITLLHTIKSIYVPAYKEAYQHLADLAKKFINIDEVLD